MELLIVRRSPILSLLAGLAVLFFTYSVRVEALDIVASVKPLEMIAAAVIGENDSTDRVVRGGQSPHHYSLRPSDMHKLHQAELIIWGGAEIEPFLAKAMQNLPASPQVLDLSKSLLLLEGGLSHSPHYWLSPLLVIKISRLVADRLALKNPKKATKYHNNAAIFAEKLAKIDKRAKSDFALVSSRKFIALHDAYQHFVDHYQLRQVGALSDKADYSHGAKNKSQLREAIKVGGVQCVISELGDELSSSQQSLTRGAAVTMVTVDPLGRSMAMSDQAFLQFYQQTVEGFYACLQGKGMREEDL